MDMKRLCNFLLFWKNGCGRGTLASADIAEPVDVVDLTQESVKRVKRDAMGAKKLNEEQYGYEIQSSDDSDYYPSDPTRSPAKVHIIRANDLTEADGAHSLLILVPQTKQNDAEGAMDAQSKKKRHPKSKKHNAGATGLQFGHDSDGVASEVEVTKFLGSSFPSQDIKSFEEFHTMVNGASVKSDLPEHIRRKYYVDVAGKILTFVQVGHRGICILSAMSHFASLVFLGVHMRVPVIEGKELDLHLFKRRLQKGGHGKKMEGDKLDQCLKSLRRQRAPPML